MKKLAIILGTATAFAFAAHTAQAQTSLRFGVKGGINGNHSKLSIDETYDKSFGFGGYAGGLAELSFPRGSKFKLQLEAVYNFNRFGYDGFNVDNVHKLHSIQIPLTLKYFIQPDFSILAGISSNTHLAGSQKSGNNESVNLSETYELNKLQIGAHIGANYYIKKGFFVEARYNYLFGDAYEYTSNVIRSESQFGMLQLGVGYKFN